LRGETRSSAKKAIIGNAAAFRITAFYLWLPDGRLLLDRYFRSADIGDI
jgi:hypothetical protein